jgi:hypothetical protein
MAAGVRSIPTFSSRTWLGDTGFHRTLFAQSTSGRTWRFGKSVGVVGE